MEAAGRLVRRSDDADRPKSPPNPKSRVVGLARDKEGSLLRPNWLRRRERRSETEEGSEIQTSYLLEDETAVGNLGTDP